MRLFIIIFFLAGNLIFPFSPLSAQPVNQTLPSLSLDEEEPLSEAEAGPSLKGLSQGTEAQAPVFSETKKIVKAIEVRGQKTIGLATIIAKIKTRVGQEYLQGVISDDIKRLYNMGFFSDVKVDREDSEGGFKVIFYVDEKPVIDKITFSKVKYYRPATLAQKIKSQKGKFLDNKILNDDIRTIEDLYAQKGLTLATVRVDKETDSLTNKVKVHFVIKEGFPVRVRKILIDGNQTFRDKKILRLIKTRPVSLFTSGYVKEDILEEDMARIKSFYEKEGFIDANSVYQYEERMAGRVDVRIAIEEGRRYYAEKIKLVGNKVVANQEVLDVMKQIREGTVFSREKLTIDLAEIRSLYFDKGYIFADVKETTSLNPETGKVEITLDVREGDLAYIRQVKIEGNDRTRDIVIRRELRLYPGDRFDGGKLRRSKERLRNLGYFEDIGYDIEDTDSPTQKDLVVQVKEAKTGTFSFGGGYSTIDQLVGFVEIEQKNFDFTRWPTFTGGGQDLVLRAEVGSTRNNMRLSFTEPWLFDHPISAGFDAYRTQRDKERDVGFTYDEERVGGDLRLGKQFSEYVSGGVTYRMENITVDNFDEGVSADLLAEEGTNTVSSLGFTLSQDKRDSVFSPTKGLSLNGTFDVAGGALGGDKDFYRFMTTTSYYVPFKFNSVLQLSLRAGWMDAYGDSEKVPIFERFFAGGGRTIRGYNERRVGPLDPVTDDPLGGESMVVGNIEYTVPIVDFIKIAAFFDAGNVWADISDFGSGGIKSGTGVGLRVKTPIGPINLDYGYPLNSEPGEDERTGKFYFSVSRGF